MRKIDADKLKERFGRELRQLIHGMKYGDILTGDNEASIKEFYKMICKEIDNEPTADDWIPVEERLPKEEELEWWGASLITVKGEHDDGSDDFVMEAYYIGPSDGWLNDECYPYELEKVSAWQLLPEPYKRRK